MNQLRRTPVSLVLLASLVLMLAAGSAFAARNQVADVNISSNSIDWSPRVAHRKLILTVSGGDSVQRMVFKSGQQPTFSPFNRRGGSLRNGSYNWELTVVPTKKLSRSSSEARGATRLVQSGSFTVKGGRFITDQTERREVAGDQQILDDLIVDGSACIGFDCVNGESFGFDTLRLKENNLRINFLDTSTSASFPDNDWRIVANDTSNGGAEYLGFEDSSAGRIPFRVEAGAPNHSLYVEDGGRIGFGTNTPVVDLHVKSGNTPTLRLEQDGSSGFGAQTWDVAGNEANFFIRDASNGSTLPLRIFPGAPSNALAIEASTGHIGLGITSPAEALHVVDAQPIRMRMQRSSDSGFWNFTAFDASQDKFVITRSGTGVAELTVDGATGDLGVGGDCIEFQEGAFHIPVTAAGPATIVGGGCP